MKVTLVAVGSKVPAWVEAGEAEYIKRLPREFSVEILQVPLAVRTRTSNIAQCKKKEGAAIRRLLKPQDFVVALDETGRQYSTRTLADRFESLRAESRDVVLLVGGPDGLDEECRQRARESWSLSLLTFPHPLVRILVAEQLYRVWSLLSGHPYHRM